MRARVTSSHDGSVDGNADHAGPDSTASDFDRGIRRTTEIRGVVAADLTVIERAQVLLDRKATRDYIVPTYLVLDARLAAIHSADEDDGCRAVSPDQRCPRDDSADDNGGASPLSRLRRSVRGNRAGLEPLKTRSKPAKRS